MMEKTSPPPGKISELPKASIAAKPALNAVIDGWFAQHFQQPPIAHTTDCYNQAVVARDALKSILGGS